MTLEEMKSSAMETTLGSVASWAHRRHDWTVPTAPVDPMFLWPRFSWIPQVPVSHCSRASGSIGSTTSRTRAGHDQDRHRQEEPYGSGASYQEHQ